MYKFQEIKPLPKSLAILLEFVLDICLEITWSPEIQGIAT